MVCLENENNKAPNFGELEALSLSAGARVAFKVVAKRDSLNSALFVGSGKLKEIKMLCYEFNSKIIIFGNELSAIQQRNLSMQLNCRVIDRVALILDIFALRANSHEGKVQVEMACL